MRNNWSLELTTVILLWGLKLIEISLYICVRVLKMQDFLVMKKKRKRQDFLNVSTKRHPRVKNTKHHEHQALANGPNVTPNPCICLLAVLCPGLFECVCILK